MIAITQKIENRQIQCLRLGSSLIEVVIVISIAAVLLGMSATMIALLMRAQGRVTDSVRETLVLSRIRRQLQQDAHSATSATVDADGKITLQLPDNQTVIFSAADHVLNRKQTFGDQTGYEAFRLTVGSTATIKLLDENELEVIRFTANRPTMMPRTTAEGPNKITSSIHHLELDAVVGHNHRFTN